MPEIVVIAVPVLVTLLALPVTFIVVSPLVAVVPLPVSTIVIFEPEVKVTFSASSLRPEVSVVNTVGCGSPVVSASAASAAAASAAAASARKASCCAAISAGIGKFRYW